MTTEKTLCDVRHKQRALIIAGDEQGQKVHGICNASLG